MRCGLLVLAALLAPGCAALNPRPPIEEFAGKLADEAIIPAVREGLARGVEHLTIQAGAQGINPRYEVQFEGKWVVGIEGRASIGVEGLSGQVQISAAGSGAGSKSGAPDERDGVPKTSAAADAPARADPRVLLRPVACGVP